MKKKGLKFFLLLVGLSLIFSGGILVVVNNYKEERNKKIEEEKQLLKEISEQYKAFQKEVEQIPVKREEVYKEVNAMVSYYSEFSKHYNKTKTLFTEYEEDIITLKANAKELETSCVGKKYKKEEVNQKCDTFIKNYEQVVNTYCNDLKKVNDLLEEYNQWIDENKETSYKKLDPITAKEITDLIDLNKDGIKEGFTD